MKTIILFLCSLITLASNVDAQVSIHRQNIQYGETGCKGCELWISLPNRGLTLTGKLYSKTWYTGATTGWVALGTHPTSIPLFTSTNQKCNLLVVPKVVITVTPKNGIADFKLFDIPNNSSLIGLRLYAQGGMIVKPGVEGFSPGVQFDIM